MTIIIIIIFTGTHRGCLTFSYELFKDDEVKKHKWDKKQSAKTQEIFQSGFTFSIRLCYWKREANLSEAKANLSSPPKTRGKQYTLLIPNPLATWFQFSPFSLCGDCSMCFRGWRLFLSNARGILKHTLIEIQQLEGREECHSVNTGYVIQEWSRQRWCLALMVNSLLKVLSPSASRKDIVFHYRLVQNDTKWFGESLQKLESPFDSIKMKLWYIITNSEFAAFLAALGWHL